MDASGEFGDLSYAEYQTGNQGTGAGVNFDAVDFVEAYNLVRACVRCDVVRMRWG